MIKELIEKRALLLKELSAMVSALKTTAEKDGVNTKANYLAGDKPFFDGTKADKGAAARREEFRAFTADEQKAYDAKKQQVEELNATIKSLSEARGLEITTPVPDGGEPNNNGKPEDKTAEEERAFVEYLRSGKALETRADSNWTPAANGAVVPTSIANKIIERVKNISPIYAMSTKYNVGGQRDAAPFSPLVSSMNTFSPASDIPSSFSE